MEDAHAKQDLEIIQVTSEGNRQGITAGVSVAEKVQEEVAKAGNSALMAELNSVKEVMEAKKIDLLSLIKGRNMTIRRAEKAVSLSNDVEKAVKVLRLELMTARESLASACSAHEEAEEHRISAALATKQHALIRKEELKRAEEEMKQLKQKILAAKSLKSELDTASNLLLSLQYELTAHMIAKLSEESGRSEEGYLKDGTDDSKKTDMFIKTSTSPLTELEEVKMHIEHAKNELNGLKVAAMALESELESEKTALAFMRENVGMASMVVSSLQAELDRTMSEVELAESKENDACQQMVQLPKALQLAAQEADEAKSVAQSAREELLKVKEEANQAKANANTMKRRLYAVLKEIEALGASNSLALATVKALQESEQIASIEFDSPGGVNLPLDEYYMLSNKTQDVEESANERVAITLSQTEIAKKSEIRILKKLQAMNRELTERKEAVRVATEKADRAEQSKLAAEQELRMWRSEHEKQREAGNAAHGAADILNCLQKDSEEHGDSTIRPELKMYVQENDTNNESSEWTVRKKKSLFPHLVMLFTRKKAEPWK